MGNIGLFPIPKKCFFVPYIRLAMFMGQGERSARDDTDRRVTPVRLPSFSSLVGKVILSSCFVLRDSMTGSSSH